MPWRRSSHPDPLKLKRNFSWCKSCPVESCKKGKLNPLWSISVTMLASAKKSHVVETGTLIKTGGKAIGSMLEKKCSIGCAYLEQKLNFIIAKATSNHWKLTSRLVQLARWTRDASCGCVCREILREANDANSKTKLLEWLIVEICKWGFQWSSELFCSQFECQAFLLNEQSWKQTRSQWRFDLERLAAPPKCQPKPLIR